MVKKATIKYYICDFCGEKYENEDDCIECLNNCFDPRDSIFESEETKEAWEQGKADGESATERRR